MEKRMVRVLLGLLALLFCASQALAVPAAPSSLVLPPTPDVDGVYKLAWYSVSGCNYVLQESKDGGAWTTIYSGSNTYIYPPKRALGSYTYQVKAVNSTGSSLWRAGARAVVVGATTAQTVPPTYLNVPAATSTSATKISFGGAALDASYVLEQAIGAGAFTAVYTGSNGYYYTVGLVDGTTYAYRVKAKVAGYADSVYFPGDTGATLAVAFPQGAAACLSCHDGSNTLAPNTSGWSAGRHANANQMPGPGVCDNCHNVNNVVGATVAQITCQGCHGTGAHTPDVDIAILSCAKCHNSHVSAVDNIATKVNAGKHDMVLSGEASPGCQRCHTVKGYLAYGAAGNNYLSAGTFTAATGTLQNVSCAACHDSHAGGTLRIPAGTSALSVGSVQYNLCTSCHNYTDASGVPVASGQTVNGVATVPMQQHSKDWYRNITTTHLDLTTTGVYGALNTALDVDRTIEGYVVRQNKDSACTDCHGHELYTNTNGVSGAVPTADTIHTEWAKSGHAGGLLKAKIAKFAELGYVRFVTTSGPVMGVGATEATGVAWTHYNWDNAGRQGCQKCHTATGAANFLDAVAAKNAGTTATVEYSAANNDFSHLAGWTAAEGSNQNELLYCWGCHKSVETGALRDPGAITADYNFKGAPAVLPSVGASNVCLACHIGQASGETITALTAAANPFTNVSFVNSHYMAAGGLVYAKIGYTNFIDPATVIGTSTYGKSLTTPEDGGLLTSTHRKLGTPAMATDSHVGGQGLVSGGPCVTCHYAAGSHTLEMDAAAFNNVCVKCHDEEAGVPLTAANFNTIFIEEQAVPFDNALALALAKLQENYNITYNKALYPYFYDQSAGGVAVKDWTRATFLGANALSAADAEKLMGACFNINVLSRDPAAYVHARTYTRRLIYDSIDFLDDKTINMSTGATAIAWDPIKYIKDATAGGTTTESFKYLAGYNRTSLVWNALERP